MLSTQRLIKKYFGDQKHPYKVYKEYIENKLDKNKTILDAGCGRNAPILHEFIGKTKSLIGVDLEDKGNLDNNINYIKGNIASIDIEKNTIDIVISRAVLEHLENPKAVFKEVNRILKPGGRFIFLAPNLWDYSALFSKMIPNKYHKYIVSKTEGRDCDNIFPAYYKANTYSSIQKLCRQMNFKIISFNMLGQYPAYFTFNPMLFLIATGYEKLISRYHCLRFLRGWILAEVRKDTNE